ncbi:hypothetical protein BPT24_209 [Tenacibaculum phage pT24]|uniref:Uncharacterized protein n=1 Tax=Tenacibaculum phage pT24 TaxID=1880590 RepID=A0A1B4XWZ9_9CAUD|nr:hypothetical protein HYP10_gp209 [Tenacibaculum phage pT24]BAV39333.1 hypothetical protein BPT24_209 [Tenacibaculum phage pT24]
MESNQTEIVVVSASLGSGKKWVGGIEYKQKVKNVVEKSKCYDTIEQNKSKRYRKSEMNKIKTNLNGTLSEDGSLVAYHMIVLNNKEDIENAENVLKDRIEQHVINIYERAKELMRNLES